MTTTLFLALQASTGFGGGALLPLLFQVAAIFGIFYFLMIRPQQRQRKQQEERLRNIKRGDEVVTSGGIVGEVVHIKETMRDGKAEKSMEDRITIKSAESRLIVERGRIARIITSSETPASS
jgi:preprotein translocase subunit YajC